MTKKVLSIFFLKINAFSINFLLYFWSWKETDSKNEAATRSGWQYIAIKSIEGNTIQFRQIPASAVKRNKAGRRSAEDISKRPYL